MKYGDKVRCIDSMNSNLEHGKVYTVDHVWGCYVNLKEGGAGLLQWRFEPVVQAEAPATSLDEQIKELEEKLRVLKAQNQAEEWKCIVEEARRALLEAGMPGYGATNSVEVDGYIFTASYH